MATIRLEMHGNVVVARVTLTDDITIFGREESLTTTSEGVLEIVASFIERFATQNLG